MGITVSSQPTKWDSAGRPVETTFKSSLFPNTTAGESFLPIFEIRQPNAFELSNVPELDEDDLIVTGNFATASFVVGDYVLIENTQGGTYSGTYRVVKVPNTDIIAIEGEYTSDDIQGTVGRYYNNLVIYAELLMSNQAPKSVTFPLQPNSAAIYTLNVSEAASRTYPSLFTEVFQNCGYAGIGAELKSVVQSYQISAWEGYDVATNGVPEFFNTKKGAKYVSNKFIIDSAHPYHHTDADGTVDLSWTDKYNGYIIGLSTAKFLTFGPRTGQVVRSGEDYFLVYLWDGNTAGGLELTFSQYNEAGTFISNTDLDIAPYVPTAPGAYLINVGPSQLSSYFSGSMAKYTVALQNSNEGLLTEAFTLTYSTDCHRADRRMFWRNELGGIDQYTFTAREDEATKVSTRTITKPYMSRTPTNVEWQERAYRTDIERVYSAWGALHSQTIQKWLAESLCESADIVTNIWADNWTKVILQDNTTDAFTTVAGATRMNISYRLGVDNRKQQQ